MFQRVAEFHRVFGHPIAESPNLPEQTIRSLRVALLAEELHEYTVAHAAGDRVEMADALADICYIVAGTCVAYGVGPINDGVFESPYDQYPPESADAGMPSLLQGCFDDYALAEQANNITWIDLSLMNMITSVFGIAWRLNIPLNAVFAEVHRSNMAKLMPDGTVLRRADGKVEKPSGWTPPDIAGILAGK
jgi:predicted HAD superfamily Cof-like phosphohydrolase